MASAQPTTTLRSARRNFRRILHPDMAPMVGLGFLLVTFFLLAADFNKPTVLQLTMPVKPTIDDQPIAMGPCLGAMTVILGKNNKVHYYQGMLSEDIEPDLHTTDLTATGLRQVLLKEKASLGKFVVLIKPSDEAKYRDIVDVLDEMSITDQYRYSLVDITQREEQMLKQYGL